MCVCVNQTGDTHAGISNVKLERKKKKKLWLVFNFLMPGAAFFSTGQGVTVYPAARRREFQRCMISDPKNPAGQPQQINNGLMDLVLLVNLCGIGKRSRTVSL